VIQTVALFLDAYRDLNSRKLFWLSLIISGLVVAIVGVLGINERGVTIFGATLEIAFFNTTFISPEVFYKLLFSNLGIKMWLSWLATILALVSTASMIPDLVAGGSIDMMLSKPISRTRLFLTRWSTGLLFVGIQSAVFVVACFLIIGIRGGAWEPSLFLAIPVLVIFFSYLFCVCALVGLLTRSTIASLIITLIFWMVVFGLQWAESITNLGRIASHLEITALEGSIDRMSAVQEGDEADLDVERLTEELSDAKDSHGRWKAFYWPIYSVVTVLPKTSQTTDWLERQLVESAKLRRSQDDDENLRMFGSRRVKRKAFEEAVYQDAADRKGALWTIGTSLGFEAVTLAFCVWYFRRRDF
jgi:hypothetical protein